MSNTQYDILSNMIKKGAAAIAAAAVLVIVAIYAYKTGDKTILSTVAGAAIGWLFGRSSKG